MVKNTCQCPEHMKHKSYSTSAMANHFQGKQCDTLNINVLSKPTKKIKNLYMFIYIYLQKKKSQYLPPNMEYLQITQNSSS